MKHPVSPYLTIKGRLAFSLLDTENQQYRSYDRYKGSLGLSYKVNPKSTLAFGGIYQETKYKGPYQLGSSENEEFIDVCFDVGICSDFNRNDDYVNFYLENRLKLNANWSVKGRISKAKRESNQDRYDYTRTTFSAGIYVKF